MLGNLINALFLAALLISAAIEGIQTCFHDHHSTTDGTNSILLKHPVTYPTILVGFAILGLILHWCTNSAHQMREEELESISASQVCSSRESPIRELNVQTLTQSNLNLNLSNPTGRTLSFCLQDYGQLKRRKFVVNSDKQRSCESLPLESSQRSNISLKSVRALQNQNNLSAQVKSVSADLESSQPSVEFRAQKVDRWLLVRVCTSPAALTTCALIVHFIHNALLNEIADATLSILVVVLLFASSYPPMKKAGKLLLQSVPEDVDLEQLKKDLMQLNPIVNEVRALQVWSLTPSKNRVGCCQLVVKRTEISSEKQVAAILEEAKFAFLKQNIKCSTIEPIIEDVNIAKVI